MLLFFTRARAAARYLANLENCPMFYESFDGAKIWYEDSGQGHKTLLWLPGGPGCCDYFESLAAQLPAEVRSVRFDPRGCGRSERKGPYSITSAVRDLQRLRQHVDVEGWYLLGHSAGADLALAFALAYPDQTNAVLAVAGGRVHNDRQWHQVYSYRRDHEGELVPDQAFPFNGHVNEQMNRSWKEYCKQPGLFKQLSRLNVPVHYLLAGADMRPNWPYQQVAELLPQGTHELIHGAQHAIWLTHPKEFKKALQHFLMPIA